MSFIKSRKLLKWLSIGAGLVLLLCAAAAFILPQLINKDMVREKIVRLLSQKIAGTVNFQRAEISLFPLPRVIIRNAELTIPEKVSGTIRTVTISPELMPLLHGEVRLAKIQVDEPSFTLRIPPKKDEKAKTLDEIAAVLRSLTLGSADIRLSLDKGSLILEKPGRSPVSIKEIVLSVKVINKKDEVLLAIERLRSKEPGISLSGEFSVNPSANKLSVEAKGKDLDIPSVRHAALGLADDVPVVLKIFDIMRDGMVEQITFESSGSALADIGKTANMKITGRLDKGNVMISGPGLDFREVSGDCEITDGILHGKGLRGEIMHTRISDGTLSVGLKGRDALFQADAAVSADLTDVHAVLTRIVKNPAFHEELGHIQAIRGNAEGRLALGENLAAVRAKVNIAKMKFTADYDRVPLPAAVERGSFSYDEKGVAIKDAAGTIGKSSFSGLSARLTTGSSYLEILSGKVNSDTTELHRWLSSYEKLKEPLRKIASISGRLDLSSLTFQGPIKDSQAWKFKLSGSAEKLMATTSLLPGPLAVNSGRFEVQPGQLTLADLNVGFLDASPVISASLSTSLESVRQGDMRLSGQVGPKALQWIQTTFSIPDYVRTDQTLAVSGARLTWQDKGDTTFQGNLKTGAGQTIALDLALGQKRLNISKLTIEDSLSRAVMQFEISETQKKFGFSGKLDTTTAARLVTTPQIQGGMVQGELTADFSAGDITGIKAQGRLRGEKVVLPWKKEMPLRIDSFELNADKGSISVTSARVRLGENAFSLKGSAASKTGNVVLDIDVSSDHISWDALMQQAGSNTKEKAQAEKKKKPLNIEGVVRLQAGRFDIQGFQIAPLHADITLRPGQTGIRIGESRLCGIGVVGDISLSSEEGRETGIDVRFDAKDQEFKPTITCISRGRSDATGLFTLKGNLKGHGKAEDFKKSITGKVEFAAKKGTIYRYKTLDTVMDFLNKGEEFKGQMPDLDKSELSYERFKITASAGNGSVAFEEAIFESAFLEVVAQGSLNLMDNRLDLNVMVAPLRQMNRVVQNIPVLGGLVSGTLISVPVKVTGTSTDPQVTYLSPSAAASNLANLMKKSMNLPVKILSPLFPKEKTE